VGLQLDCGVISQGLLESRRNRERRQPYTFSTLIVMATKSGRARSSYVGRLQGVAGGDVERTCSATRLPVRRCVDGRRWCPELSRAVQSGAGRAVSLEWR
jgi:hypothetical protein